MKRLMASMMIILMLVFAFAGCADTKYIDGVKYNYYGLFNKDSQKNPDIEYRVVLGNVVWGIILVETVIAPVIIAGWFLWEPVRIIDSTRTKGQISP